MEVSLLLPPKDPKHTGAARFDDEVDQGRSASGLSVIVVEDDFFSLLEAESVAIEAGLQVVATAASAEEALRVIEEFRPDLVLMDINLGSSRDGIDVALEVNKRFGIRSLFTTAYSDTVFKTRAAPGKPLGWVIKPFSSTTLENALLDAVEQLKPKNS